MSFAVFSPNEYAGMVTLSIDENSLNNLVKLYIHSSPTDLGTASAILNKLPQSSSFSMDVNSLYFHNFMLSLEGETASLKATAVINGESEIVSLFHSSVSTANLSGRLGLSLSDGDLISFVDENHVSTTDVDMELCLTEMKLTNVELHTSTDFSLADLVFPGMTTLTDALISSDLVEDYLKDTLNYILESDRSNMARLANGKTLLNSACFSITKDFTTSYPKFADDFSIIHSGVKIENDEIIAYGCPVLKPLAGDNVYIGDFPCGTVVYKFHAYTGKSAGAGTDAGIKVTLCGKDYNGIPGRCVKGTLNGDTEKNGISFARVEFPYLLVDDFSIVVENDDSGSGSAWYLDSVTVDAVLPNNKIAFHKWFPADKWIGGSNPNIYTLDYNASPHVYEFNVVTGEIGNMDGAGTNADVVAEICDVNNKCLLFNLDRDGYDDFEAGDTDSYTFVTDEALDDIKSLKIHWLYGVSSGWPDIKEQYWYLNSVTYKHYVLTENGAYMPKEEQYFPFHQWFDCGSSLGSAYLTTKYCKLDISKLREVKALNKTVYGHLEIVAERANPSNLTEYAIVINTANSDGAGTNSDITMKIEGCSGAVESFNLDNTLNNFEKGDTDVFWVLGNKDLKGIRKVTITSDGSGSGSEWIVDQILIDPNVYVDGEKIPYVGPISYLDDSTNNGTVVKVIKAIDEDNSLSWETGTCPNVTTPLFTKNEFDVLPGETVTIPVLYAPAGAHVVLNLATSIKPIYSSTNVLKFRIPENTPVGEYSNSVVIEGFSYGVTIRVLNPKPVLDDIAITTVEPGSTFEVKAHNINDSSRFYLGDNLLTVFMIKDRGVVLTVPENIKDGRYNFRIVSNEWDEVFDETISVINDFYPVVYSVSKTSVRIGDVVDIVGKKFGNDKDDVLVDFGGVLAEIISVSENKISVKIPTGLHGDKIPMHMSRKGNSAMEKFEFSIVSQPSFFSFDDKSRPWTNDDGKLRYDSTIKVGETGSSLEVLGGGYTFIRSPLFNTYELDLTSNRLMVDIWVPKIQVNPYWYGDFQLFVDIPSANIYNAYVGINVLTGLAPGWNTVTFEFDEQVFGALSSNHPNAQLIFALNVNNNPENYRIDNIRFDSKSGNDANEHVVAGTELNAYSVSFMSFDNANDWNSPGNELLSVSSPKQEGEGALGIYGNGYMVIKSRNFSPSELENVSNTISVNLYIPNPQPNVYWVGTLEMSVNCPANGINDKTIGQKNLTGLPRDVFNSIQYTLPMDVISALTYGTGSCNISLILNVNQGSGLYVFDNMGFVNAIEIAKAW